MALLAANVATLTDVVKATAPDGSIADVVEMLHQDNEMLTDMLWKEGNLESGHRTTVRTGLPSAAWRLLNAGVSPSKGTTAQIDEACGKLESWNEVDVALAKLNGNEAAFRLLQARAHIEAMNQEMQSTVIYGNSSVAQEEFTGLAARYSSTSAESGRNIVSGGSADTDNTSIWLIVWGEHSISGIYPRGSVAGLQHNDLGEETAETSAAIGGTRLRVYRDQFIWDCGIALYDWRYVVRIPNIEVSALGAKSSAADLTELMIKATHRIKSLRAGRAAFYMNRSVIQALDIQRRDDVISGGGLTFSNVDGMRELSFRGIPCRLVDQILETESLVS